MYSRYFLLKQMGFDFIFTRFSEARVKQNSRIKKGAGGRKCVSIFEPIHEVLPVQLYSYIVICIVAVAVVVILVLVVVVVVAVLLVLVVPVVLLVRRVMVVPVILVVLVD